LQKRSSDGLKFLFQPLCAIAAAARPWLAAIEVTTLAPVVRILHFHQLKELLPIGSFLFERRGTIANLNPPNVVAGNLTGFTHIPEILAFSNRAFSQGSAFNCVEQ